MMAHKNLLSFSNLKGIKSIPPYKYGDGVSVGVGGGENIGF